MIKEQVSGSVRREGKACSARRICEHLERFIILQIIDNQWVAHLQDMENMKEGIGLRGYGQLDPLKEYQEGGLCPVRGSSWIGFGRRP